MYRIVSKLTPIKLGSRKVSRPESQVPSPTCRVLDAYVLLPAAARSEFDILWIILERPCNLKSGMSDLPKEIFRDLPIGGMHHAITGSEFQLKCQMTDGPVDCKFTS